LRFGTGLSRQKRLLGVFDAPASARGGRHRQKVSASARGTGIER
jgi:hypothetical protein